MIEVSTVAELRAEIAKRRAAGHRVAFVPTMGNLHAGHRRLMECARDHADTVVASIYVNPLQFGPREDFDAYPRTPDADRRLLGNVGVNVLFMPAEHDMYPRGRAAQTFVEVPVLGDILCGAHRPGHFRGVTTVVARLFNVVMPDVALFGKKDYQQLMLIRLMAQDLGFAIEIIGVDTVRDADGLALSSRNGYLAAEERGRAPTLYATLTGVRDAVQAGAALDAAEAGAVERLRAIGFRPEYVSIRRQRDLAEPDANDTALVVLAAGFLGRTRLIDNLEFSRLKPHG
jgi:pantoate--beta-alanine ligase